MQRSAEGRASLGHAVCQPWGPLLFAPRRGTPGRGLYTALAVYSPSRSSSVLSKMRAIQAQTSSPPDNAICFDTHGMTGWYKAFPLPQSCQFSSATCDYFYGVYFNIYTPNAQRSPACHSAAGISRPWHPSPLYLVTCDPGAAPTSARWVA